MLSTLWRRLFLLSHLCARTFFDCPTVGTRPVFRVPKSSVLSKYLILRPFGIPFALREGVDNSHEAKGIPRETAKF
jgi:hypothetical protein